MIDSQLERKAYSLENKKAIRTRIKRDLEMVPAMCPPPAGFVDAATKELHRLEEEIAQEQADIDACRRMNRRKKLSQGKEYGKCPNGGHEAGYP